ncbi:hypothetical protein EDD11_000988 [Mortierella claussenii]|nr:hypothetical protein EDD11_000988 [Mortierella claussenii]
MRFQTIIASVLVLAVASSSSLVAAQNSTTTPPTVTPACQTCIVNQVKTIGNCAQADVNPSGATDPSKLSPAEKQCFCSIASDTTWTQKCVSADTCGADVINLMVTGLGDAKGQYCQGAAASGKNAATTLGSVTGVTIAFAAAFAQALL